jgi:hypothetical protein
VSDVSDRQSRTAGVTRDARLESLLHENFEPERRAVLADHVAIREDGRA